MIATTNIQIKQVPVLYDERIQLHEKWVATLMYIYINFIDSAWQVISDLSFVKELIFVFFFLYFYVYNN